MKVFPARFCGNQGSESSKFPLNHALLVVTALTALLIAMRHADAAVDSVRLPIGKAA